MGTMGVPVRVAMTVTPPLASVSPWCSTRVPSGNTRSRRPSPSAFMAVFMAERSFPPRLTGNAPSLRISQFSTGMRNRESLAMKDSRESLGRQMAMRTGSQPLA